MSLLHPKLQKCSFTTVSETLRLSDVSVWRCGSFSVHEVLSSGLMCEGPVSAGKRRTARTQDLVSTCLCRASAWAFRLRNSTWTKSVRVFLISNWGENLKRTFSICYNYFLHLRKWNLWELVRIQSWCSWWRPETSCFIWQKKFFVVFLLAGVSELHDSTLDEAVLTWLLFSARRVSTRSLTLNGFPTRTVILWKTTKYVKKNKKPSKIRTHPGVRLKASHLARARNVGLHVGQHVAQTWHEAEKKWCVSSVPASLRGAVRRP